MVVKRPLTDGMINVGVARSGEHIYVRTCVYCKTCYHTAVSYQVHAFGARSTAWGHFISLDKPYIAHLPPACLPICLLQLTGAVL